MKRFIVISTVVTMLIASQTNTALGTQLTSTQTTTTGGQAQTATKNGLVHANIPRIPKPKVFRSNPFRAAYFAANPDRVNDINIDDDDKISGYRKRDLQRIRAESTPDDPDGTVTDDIKWKLFLARQVALLKHRELYS